MTSPHVAYVLTMKGYQLPSVGGRFTRTAFPHVISAPHKLAGDIDTSGSFDVVTRVTAVEDPFMSKEVVCVVDELYPAWNRVSLYAYVLECMQPLRGLWKWYMNGDTRADTWLDTLELCCRAGRHPDDSLLFKTIQEVNQARTSLGTAFPVAPYIASAIWHIAMSMSQDRGDPTALHLVFSAVAKHATVHRSRQTNRQVVHNTAYVQTVEACSALAVSHLRRHR